MKVGFYGTPSERQQAYLDCLIEAGHEVIQLEPNDQLNGLSFDAIFVDEHQEMVEDESWKAMIEPTQPNNKPYYRQKERYQ